MALISWSPLVTDARGRIGGTCFTLTRWGSTVRIWQPPHQPLTPLQLLQRGQLATFSQLWHSAPMLSYRPGWITLALANPYRDVFNALRYLTGLTMFNKLNRSLQAIGESSIIVAPGSISCGNPVSITAAHSGGTPDHLNITPAANPAPGEAVIIRTTPPLSQGITRISNRQTILKIINPGVAGPWDVYTEYTTKYPHVTAQQMLFAIVNYVQISTGFQGNEFSCSVVW